MRWCDDIKSSNYNKLISSNIKAHSEKLFRRDSKYDLIIPIKYNFKNQSEGKEAVFFFI